MPPMTTIESPDKVHIPTKQLDEEFQEEFVESFIARANRIRRAQGLSDLCVGALASPCFSGMIRADAELPCLDRR